MKKQKKDANNPKFGPRKKKQKKSHLIGKSPEQNLLTSLKI